MSEAEKSLSEQIGDLNLLIHSLKEELNEAEKQGKSIGADIRYLGETLEDTREEEWRRILYADENGFDLLYHPRKSKQIEVTVEGQTRKLTPYPDLKSIVVRIYELRTQIKKNREKLKRLVEGRGE